MWVQNTIIGMLLGAAFATVIQFPALAIKEHILSSILLIQTNRYTKQVNIHTAQLQNTTHTFRSILSN